MIVVLVAPSLLQSLNVGMMDYAFVEMSWPGEKRKNELQSLGHFWVNAHKCISEMDCVDKNGI